MSDEHEARFKLTLTDLKEAIERQFRPLEIDLEDGNPPVKLANPLRLSDGERAVFSTLEDRAGENGENMRVAMRDTLHAVIVNKGDIPRIDAVLGEDLAVISEIFQHYAEATSLGEAISSAA